MERQREVKALLKRWEAAFLRERRRKPSQADIEEAPEDTRRLYREYKMLKQQREESDRSRSSPPGQPAPQETPTTEQVPDTGCWGAHLNRKPKTPKLSRPGAAVPKSSSQYYGMKLKSKLGAAGKETPLTPRRTPTPSRVVPKPRTDPGTGDKAASPAPVENSRSEGSGPGDLLLPPSVAGLAPVILTAGLKPPPAPPDKFHRLKQTVVQRLGSLDPGWLRRCQGTPGDEGVTAGARQERGELGCAPPEQEGVDGEQPAGDSGRKRPHGDGGDSAVAPAKLRRRRRGSAEGPFGMKRSEEEEEHAAPQTETDKASDPSENILGEVEEKEKPRSNRRAGAARAPPRSGGNFVRLNLRKKSHVRGSVLQGNRLRKQLWKQKWQRKAKDFGGGGGSMDRSSDVCFRCGGTGHWASECPGRGTRFPAEPAAGSPPEANGPAAEEEEAPLPTLEEVARRTNSVCRELPGNGREGSETISEATAYVDAQRPAYEPPAPVEPLYDPGPEGKVRETPEEVFEALEALGYSSFRPGQEVAVMRILSGLSTLVVLSTGMGKSLCYQLPAYLYHKRSKCITLVVSPLVSLMDDQVSGLPPCLKAVCIHSNMTKSQREAVMEKVRQGEVQVLLLSPEALVGRMGSGSSCLPSADRLPAVAFACIDEAHCVSEWSHNFRPCYLQLCKVLRDRLGVRCFLGLTATATLATARDVAQHLGIPAEEGIPVHSAAVPPNLRLSVSTDRDRDQALISLLQGERFGSLDSIIVYCTRREETDRIAALIRTCLQGIPLRECAGAGEAKPDGADRKKAKGERHGLALRQDPKQPPRRPPKWLADAYHAGLSAAERRRVQNGFMSGRLRVVVATVAFGMGLDKSDVRGVVHYNMPKNFECYVQEIGRAGRDGRLAHCHLFLDPEGGDLHELRRHVHGDTVDLWTVKKLVQLVFTPCKCPERHRNRQDVVGRGEADGAGRAELPEEDAGGAAERRACYKHERAIPIRETVESLDLREEGVETLLCYLELHPRRWLELLPPTYSSCRLLCYGGSPQLRAAAWSSPPVALFLARERLAGRDHSHASSLEFDVVSLSDSMGWEVPLVKRALRQLQWDPRLRQGGRGDGKSGILVEFGDLSFHVRAYGDLSGDELDSVCDFLHRRVVARERAALGQLRACFQAFQSVAFQTYGPHPTDEEEERSSSLKALLNDYFQKEPSGEEPERGCEEEEGEDLGDDQLRDWENRIRADVRHFLAIRPDEKFSGRAVARIFHGIGSPCFPAQIYGRDRRFWRKHLHFGFHRLTRLATEEILASRTPLRGDAACAGFYPDYIEELIKTLIFTRSPHLLHLCRPGDITAVVTDCRVPPPLRCPVVPTPWGSPGVGETPPPPPPKPKFGFTTGSSRITETIPGTARERGRMGEDGNRRKPRLAARLRAGRHRAFLLILFPLGCPGVLPERGSGEVARASGTLQPSLTSGLWALGVPNRGGIPLRRSPMALPWALLLLGEILAQDAAAPGCLLPPAGEPPTLRYSSPAGAPGGMKPGRAGDGLNPSSAALNAALGRPARQSSVFPNTSIAANAVDGNRDGVWHHGSCSRTLPELEPWWSVDLGGRRVVAAVVVKNRQDCCWRRLRGAQVHVGDAPAERGRDNPICGTITDAGPGSLSTVCCHGLPGRYVSILIPGREDALVLCEVEVVLQGCLPLPGGEGLTVRGPAVGGSSGAGVPRATLRSAIPAPNVARGRAVAQSSTLNAAGLAANAVDGNADADWERGSCAHTEKEPEPWWRVDLGRRRSVYSVTVTNRRDCCWESLRGAQVHVGDSLADRGKRNPVCGTILDTGPGSASTVCCNGLPGRYVSILIPGREDFLVLCEVEVTAQSCVPPPGGIRSLCAEGRGRGGRRVWGGDVTRVPKPVAHRDAAWGCPGAGKDGPQRKRPWGDVRPRVVPGAGVTVSRRPPAQNLALRRPAAQSSTVGRAGSAVNAVDGNWDGNWRHGSCSQTEREREPWWTVDLGWRRAVAAVVVRNRLDCCWHRLKGARVHVGDSLAGHGTCNPVCGTVTDTGPGSASTVCCHGLRGRYVTVAVPGREERLSLCEVEVVEQGCAVLPGAQNVALGRPAAQSSVLDAGSGAANAVDGNRDGDWERGSCSHTAEEPEPWWRVDLGRRHAVYAVVVKNRRDCCWRRLKGAEVRVGDSLVDRGRRNPACGIITDAGPGSLSTVCCHGLRGRYVTVTIPGREDALVLCEVEVIRQGCAPLPGAPNVAREQRATQSSTSTGSGAASNAVDGNRDGVWHRGSCSHTRRELEPWWSVDLGGRRVVAAVVVKNRQDCCWRRLRGARVHVGDAPAERGRDNPICGTITDAGPGSLSTVCCHGLPGRYVTVTIPGREERLALCEVEVYTVSPER
ncbi:LOW QUALITY PROTEIN: ATP-dependent DNA helicase Q4 [Rhynochetos jubatus]